MPATIPARTTYVCRLKENPYKVFFGTCGGVSLERYRLKTFDRADGRQPMSVVPTHQLTDEQAKHLRKAIDDAVLRAGSGIVKLKGRPPTEGDLPLEQYVDFQPAESDMIATYQAEIEKLRAQLDAERAKALKDDDDEAEAGQPARKPGPRNK